jgi:hypothetical protein
MNKNNLFLKEVFDGIEREQKQTAKTLTKIENKLSELDDILRRFVKASVGFEPHLLQPIKPRYWHLYLDSEYGEIRDFTEAKDKESAVKEFMLDSRLREYNDEVVAEHVEEVSEEIYRANKE